MRLHAGEVAGFRRKRSGNVSRARYLPKETYWTQGDCIQQRQAVSALSKSSATAGSGRPAPTPGTRVTGHFLARSANTTASLCAVRWFYVEGPASRLRVMCVPPIAISFNQPLGGSSMEYVWQLKGRRDALGEHARSAHTHHGSESDLDFAKSETIHTENSYTFTHKSIGILF